jgi:hypothetical protein
MFAPFVVQHMCNIAMPESAHPVPENNAHEIMPLVFERAATAPSRGMPANERTILVRTVVKRRVHGLSRAGALFAGCGRIGNLPSCFKG